MALPPIFNLQSRWVDLAGRLSKDAYDWLFKLLAALNGGQQSFYRVAEFNTAGIAAGVTIGSLPVGAFVVGTDVRIATAFNAGGNDDLEVGTAADPDGFATAAGTAAAVAGYKPNLVGAQNGVVSATAATPVVVKYTQTGGAATTGRAEILVRYYVPSTN